ncbi:RNA methyltransferase [Arenibaculum pallidiluteum]|uniref:RNA methyltransferase n=1 Tax=Arenibaculum pallidiluteum TaxID=2812559 RepID=UPI001A966E00|nr:RNA methyltransferase [Arenibaculum pallidiluteum]
MTSGTNPARDSVTGGPAVVLVDPQLGENIGAAARAMLNCGLTDLRLVRPRDGWPNEKAVAASSGATAVLDAARVFDRVEDALADLTYVLATTARLRDQVKRILTPRGAAVEMRARWQAGERPGVMFGPERTGLVNDDIALADAVLSVPLNPSFCSLNLAQAVLLIGYEWFQTGDVPPDRAVHIGQSRPATKDELLNLFDRFEGELDAGGFFTADDKRPTMVRNLRNMFLRAEMTEQEVRTFHGVIAALTGRRKVHRRS